MPKISVIIPTYNRYEMLSKAVDSVLNQSFLDYELIICDNSSNDKTQEYCTKLANENKKVRYHRNKKNLGMVGNWNTGLSLTKGKFINILMDDDELFENFLKETYAVLNNNDDIGFVVSRILYSEINSEGQAIIDRNKSKKFKLHLTNKLNHGVEGLKKYIYKKLRIGLPSGILFRKDNNFCFNEYGLDPGFWLDYCNKYQFYYYLNKPLCLKKVHDGDQFSTSKISKIYYRRIIYNLNKSYSYLLEKNKLNKSTEQRYFKHIEEMIKYLS